MSTFADDILDVAGDDPIMAIVIGEMGWGDYQSEKVPGYGDMPKGKVINWIEAQPYLNYEYDTGYGAPSCQAIYAWTKNKIIFVVQYDGSTNVHWIPRNPVDIMPVMPGG